MASIYERLPTLEPSLLLELIRFEKPFSEGLLAIISSVDDIGVEDGPNEHFVLRDEAAGWFWKQRLHGSTEVSVEAFSDLAANLKFPCVRGILGDLSCLDILSEDQILYVLENVDPSEYAWKQAKARQLLSSLPVNPDACRTAEVLRNLLDLNKLWAVEELLPFLNSNQLEGLLKLASGKAIFTRRDKHFLRQSISTFLKTKG